MSTVHIPSQCQLYGILDLGYVKESQAIATAKHLMLGGIGILQLRAKGVGKDKIETLAGKLAPACKEHRCLFIVNDYPDIAKHCDADGVHVGQDQAYLSNIKEYMGKDKIVGRSTHSYEQAIKAYQDGADYIGFGPLYPTPTKQGRPGIGLGEIARVHSDLPVDFPIFCIGGINEKTLPEVLKAGAKRVVIVSGLLQHERIRSMTEQIIAQINEATK